MAAGCAFKGGLAEARRTIIDIIALSAGFEKE